MKSSGGLVYNFYISFHISSPSLCVDTIVGRRVTFSLLLFHISPSLHGGFSGD
jgi:hypothetical protein